MFTNNKWNSLMHFECNGYAPIWTMLSENSTWLYTNNLMCLDQQNVSSKHIGFLNIFKMWFIYFKKKSWIFQFHFSEPTFCHLTVGPWQNWSTIFYGIEESPNYGNTTAWRDNGSAKQLLSALSCTR